VALFNGSDQARFYLTFLVGPEVGPGVRSAGVRLQLERDGRTETFGQSAEVDAASVARAPDLSIGKSTVTLDGLLYRIHLDLRGEGDVWMMTVAEYSKSPLSLRFVTESALAFVPNSDTPVGSKVAPSLLGGAAL
jgi:hypothetical protein